MSKEVAAAILTQVYFECSKTAAEAVEQKVSQSEVERQVSQGTTTGEGGITSIVEMYAKVLKMMDKLALSASIGGTGRS